MFFKNWAILLTYIMIPTDFIYLMIEYAITSNMA